MASFNKVILMGNLTRDPQLRVIGASGTQVADFGVAVNRKWKGPNGEDREEVTFVDVTSWGRQAEVISQYFKKGSPIFISGRLKTDVWNDAQSGQKRSKLSVVVEEFQFVGNKSGGDDQQENRASRTGRSSTPAKSVYDGGEGSNDPQEFKDEDIPF